MRTEVCNSLCGLHESRELLILDGRVASYKKKLDTKCLLMN